MDRDETHRVYVGVGLICDNHGGEEQLFYRGMRFWKERDESIHLLQIQ